MPQEGLSVGAPGLGLLLSRRSPVAICTSRGLTAAGISPLGWNLLSSWQGHSVTFAHLGCLIFGGVGGYGGEGHGAKVIFFFFFLCFLYWQEAAVRAAVRHRVLCPGVSRREELHYRVCWYPCCHLGPAWFHVGWVRVGPGCGELRPCLLSLCRGEKVGQLWAVLLLVPEIFAHLSVMPAWV